MPQFRQSASFFADEPGACDEKPGETPGGVEKPGEKKTGKKPGACEKNR